MKNVDPIYYKSSEEMNKPLSELMDELSSEIVKVRGKLRDIRHIHGWEDRIDFIEGGLTCILIAMHSTLEEWKEFEIRKQLK